jgi:hypothetical protein
MSDKPYNLQDSVEVLGKRWKLTRPTRLPEGRMADCDPPWKTGKSIRIKAGLTPELVLRCLIHEMTHGAFWWLDENYVERFAEDVERELIRNGFVKFE